MSLSVSTKQWAALVLAACVVTGAISAIAAITKNDDPNNPTGSNGLILIDKVGHHVRFFDSVSWKELANIETGINPHDIALSPDHKTAYMTIYGPGIYGSNPTPDHTIAIVDIGSRKQTGVIDVSPYVAPHGIQIDRAGKLYVSCDTSRKLLIIDPKTKKIESAIDTEGTGHWVAILPDASKAWVVNKNDRLFISVIDLKARKMIGKIPTPNGTEGIAVSPDGKNVAAIDFAEPFVLMIDPKTDTIREKLAITDNHKAAARVRFSPDGSKMLVDNSAEQLVNIFNTADLHGKQAVINVGKSPMGFGFAPDNKIAIVGNHGDGSVSVIDMKEGKEITRFNAGQGIETMTWY